MCVPHFPHHHHHRHHHHLTNRSLIRINYDFEIDFFSRLSLVSPFSAIMIKRLGVTYQSRPHLGPVRRCGSCATLPAYDAPAAPTCPFGKLDHVHTTLQRSSRGISLVLRVRWKRYTLWRMHFSTTGLWCWIPFSWIEALRFASPAPRVPWRE